LVRHPTAAPISGMEENKPRGRRRGHPGWGTRQRRGLIYVFARKGLSRVLGGVCVGNASAKICKIMGLWRCRTARRDRAFNEFPGGSRIQERMCHRWRPTAQVFPAQH